MGGWMVRWMVRWLGSSWLVSWVGGWSWRVDEVCGVKGGFKVNGG